MFERREDAAVAAVLSMLLEVSGTPKAGNVDREHDFIDLRYEHFLASASSVFPVFLKATSGGGVGELILNAVSESRRWHRAGNVHFGAFLLLIPLLKAWDAKNAEKAGIKASMEVRKTTYIDSIKVLKAFRSSQARVMDAETLDLASMETEENIEAEKIDLHKWMMLAPEENVIAKELVNDFKLSVSNSKYILEVFDACRDVNYSIVLGYLRMLSNVRDPLIISKFGIEVADDVCRKAAGLLDRLTGNPERDIDLLRGFDGELIRAGINPGSVADLTISSIYLALMEGLRF
jgi:triphosphoribosyl-dephospho-CoA synthase